MPDDLRVELTHVPRSKARGEFVLPAVTVTNEGTDPTTVSTRLNLVEGDLVIDCRRPSGNRTDIRGPISVDSLPRTAELSAGQSLSSGLFLFYAAAGFTFDVLGEYELVAKYSPGPPDETVTSDPVTVRIKEPSTDELRTVASQTMVESVGRTIALCGLETEPAAVERVESLAERVPTRPEGAVARLVLAEIRGTDDVDVEAVLDRWGPTRTSRWITALVPGGDAERGVKAESIALLERSKRMLRERPYR